MSTIVQLTPPVNVTPRSHAEPGNLRAVASQYLTQLSRRGRSTNTIKSYETDLGQFVGYMQGRAIDYVQHVTGEVVEQFLDSLMQANNLKPVSVARKRETLRGLFTWCMQRNLIGRNPVDDTMSITWTSAVRIAPSEAALLRAIEAIPADTVLGLRDRAFFRLMFDAAMRASEPCKLDVYDPNNPPRNTVAPNGMVQVEVKGGRLESNPLDDTTMQYLQAWLDARHNWARADQRALFVNRLGQRVTRQAMHARCKAMGEAAGLPDLHMHLFRHCRAGTVIEKLGLREGSLLLHHKNINTTSAVYGHICEAHRHQRLRKECRLGGNQEDIA